MVSVNLKDSQQIIHIKAWFVWFQLNWKLHDINITKKLCEYVMCMPNIVKWSFYWA